MIDIGTIRFNFRMENEDFAQALYRRWDAFFAASFEQVAEEVLSVYNLNEEVITVEQLPIDLGEMTEDDFDTQFPLRLREALYTYFHDLQTATADDSVSIPGVQRVSVSRSLLDTLCFFLLHGYLPASTPREYTDISRLLATVLESEPYRFREFLESYAHYAFLYHRLVAQFSDDELDAIIDKVHPSESKFISLYARTQIQAYRQKTSGEISYTDYRNAVWTLVLAYLFTESSSRFNRKQLVLHTLRGLSAHFNQALAQWVRLLTSELHQLEQRMAYLPELMDILKEIRESMKDQWLTRDAGHLEQIIRDIVLALRRGHAADTTCFLSPEYLTFVLSRPESCRKLLAQLREEEIYRLVECVIPQESEFIIAYAKTLDRHQEQGTFAGKAGGDFRLIKWEFIFAVLYQSPLSSFSRRQFVLSVVQRLAAHYNLSVTELIRLLILDQEMDRLFASSDVLSILAELGRSFQSPLRFFREHSEAEIHHFVRRYTPERSEFIIQYASLLERESTRGLLEGKAGAEFRVLKWEFIFACLLEQGRTTFQRKQFVLSVLRQLAAHYNQRLEDLLTFFYREWGTVTTLSADTGLQRILQELHDEVVWTVADRSFVRQMNREHVESLVLRMFGPRASIAGQDTDRAEQWLTCLLEEQTDLLRSLWKAGRLDTALLFVLINRRPLLQRLWIRRIGDARLLEIWMHWTRLYAHLRHERPDLSFLSSIATYLAVWMVQLTAREYTAWSEREIEQFLHQRVRQSIPPGMAALADSIHTEKQNIHLQKIVENMEKEETQKVGESQENKIGVQNAGLMLLSPYFRMLFARLNYLENNLLAKEEMKLRAIFLLQYAVFGKEQQYKEQELFLNKIIVGWPADKTLPKALALTDTEKEMINELLKSASQNWQKMRNVANDTFRQAFLMRGGWMEYKPEERQWVLTVEERPYDLLIDTVPWSFKMFRFPGNDYFIMTKWRDR